MTANYTFGTSVDGKLEIAKREVTVTAASEQFTYDGTVHSNDGYKVEGLAGNDEIKAVVTGSITFPSQSPVTNELTSYEFTTGNADNYTVKTVNGELTMVKAEQAITITAASQSWTYDGKSHRNTEVTLTAGELLTGDKLVANATGSVKNVTDNGNGNNPIAAGYKIMHGNEDVTENYKITTVAGTLTINPKKASVIAIDNKKTYGDEDPTLRYRTEGLVGNDYIAATVKRDEGEDAGEYTIKVTATPNPNYEIEEVPGTFTIEPKAVTVTADDKSKRYGTGDPELTATIEGLVEGESEELIKFELNREQGEDVGDYEITPDGEARQGNYTVTYVTGTLTIVPADAVVVTITANNGTYKYDGQEKDLSGYSVSISDPLYKETDFTFSGSNALKGVDAGTYRTQMKASDFTNINENFTDVHFQVENGKLEITKRNVTLTSADDEKPYDGTALTNNKVTVSGDGFASGEGVNLTVTGRITQVGRTDNTFSYTMAEGTKAGNYNITTVYGTLIITPAPVHKLTIHYVYAGGAEFDRFMREYANGESYTVKSPRKTGYKADTEIVSGTMENEDIEVTVTYRPIEYTLTVYFVSITDGRELARPVVMTLRGGDTYTVFVPYVEGYRALVDEVNGVMPYSDREITVFMIPEDEPDPERYNETVKIDDYGTPLGVGDSILGGGEIIE